MKSIQLRDEYEQFRFATPTQGLTVNLKSIQEWFIEHKQVEILKEKVRNRNKQIKNLKKEIESLEEGYKNLDRILEQNGDIDEIISIVKEYR